MADELHSALRTLGLTNDEAELYFALVKFGPLTVGQLSEHTTVGRTKIYAVLDEMMGRGFVSRTGERPKTYVPANPEELLARHRASYEDAWSTAQDGLVPLYREAQVPTASVITLRGSQVYSRSAMIFAEAQRTLKIVSPMAKPETLQESEAMVAFGALTDAIARGVEVVFVTDPSLEGLAGAPQGATIRYEPVPAAGLVVADDERVLLVSLEGEAPNVVASGIYTESAELAELLTLVIGE